MKKTIKLLALALIGIMGVAMAACSDDDKKESVEASQLPAKAIAFIGAYYPGVEIASVVKDTDDGCVEYDVYLKNGAEIDFTYDGEWKEVDAPAGAVIPEGIAPAATADYISENYPDNGINEISKTRTGYEAKLLSGLKIAFNEYGNFIKILN